MRAFFYQVFLKAIAIIRRMFEPCFREMQEGWQDLDDIVTWENLRLFPLAAVDETVLHIPLCRKKRHSVFNAPFDPKDIAYFLKKLDTGREVEEFTRFWTVYWLSKGKTVTEYLFFPIGSNLRFISLAVVEDLTSYGLFIMNFEGWFSNRQEALEKAVSMYGVDNQPNIIVKYKTWR